jgi:hypothetical protein
VKHLAVLLGTTLNRDVACLKMILQGITNGHTPKSMCEAWGVTLFDCHGQGGGGPFLIDVIPPYSEKCDPWKSFVLNLSGYPLTGIVLY